MKAQICLILGLFHIATVSAYAQNYASLLESDDPKPSYRLCQSIAEKVIANAAETDSSSIIVSDSFSASISKERSPKVGSLSLEKNILKYTKRIDLRGPNRGNPYKLVISLDDKKQISSMQVDYPSSGGSTDQSFKYEFEMLGSTCIPKELKEVFKDRNFKADCRSFYLQGQKADFKFKTPTIEHNCKLAIETESRELYTPKRPIYTGRGYRGTIGSF